MPFLMGNKDDAKKAAKIVQDAGGQVIGKTRLQKMAYLLEITELGDGFHFEYRHYGPFSESLASAISLAQLWDLLSEEERVAVWGGSYSIFKATSSEQTEVNPARKQVLELCVKANPVALELAATAAFLAREGHLDPWAETKKRKPEKADRWLRDAKSLYADLRKIETKVALPQI